MRQTQETAGLVLVVEDNRNISEMIGEYLESRGFEVDYATDGLDGYRLAVENSYDVLILDLMLPRMDGMEVCRRLRNEARKSTPVLMLTARDTLDDKLTGFCLLYTSIECVCRIGMAKHVRKDLNACFCPNSADDAMQAFAVVCVGHAITIENQRFVVFGAELGQLTALVCRVEVQVLEKGAGHIDVCLLYTSRCV